MSFFTQFSILTLTSPGGGGGGGGGQLNRERDLNRAFILHIPATKLKGRLLLYFTNDQLPPNLDN